MDVLSKIQFNKEVTKIDYSQSSKTIVKCADGSIYEADHVIVTVSLGVLKANYKNLFTPALDDKKVAIIENYAYGSVGKVFLEFEEIFWDDFDASSFLWLEKDVNELGDRKWLLGVVAFLKVISFPHLLEGFISGEHVKTFEEISDEKLIDDCMWVLEKFFNRELPKPKAMRRTRWESNPHFLGTYSYINVGLENLNFKDLAEPIRNFDGKPFIHFAGEATDFKYPGYVHGAVDSGYRAANEIDL